MNGTGPAAVMSSLVLAALLSTSGCGRRPAVRADADDVYVTTVVVADAPPSGSLERYPVTLTRDREAGLSFRVSGTVRSIAVRIGQVVAAGTVLSTLDPTPYVAARIRAEEELARLTRAADRNRSLVPAGALAPSASEDTDGAVASARAALANARYDESSAAVRAPFRGVILTRDVEIGETVANGQRLLRIADLGSASIAHAAVPRDLAQRLGIGDAATVSFDADRSAVVAAIRHVGALADARSGTVEIELTVAGNLPSGAVGSVSFERGGRASDGQQRLPAEALLDVDRGRGHVFLVESSTSLARKTEIGVGGFDGEALSVSGLQPGARVITYGAGFVRDGQKVAVVTR